MKSNFILTQILFMTTLSPHAQPKTGENNITMGQAIAIAQSNSKGFIFESTLEKKNGIFYYSVALATGGRQLRKINIDARTGKVTEIENRKDIVSKKNNYGIL